MDIKFRECGNSNRFSLLFRSANEGSTICAYEGCVCVWKQKKKFSIGNKYQLL